MYYRRQLLGGCKEHGKQEGPDEAVVKLLRDTVGGEQLVHRHPVVLCVIALVVHNAGARCMMLEFRV